MPRRIVQSQLSANTATILNTIRANASAQYQNDIPEITQATDIPKVGELLYGNPTRANEFLSELINQIAMVRITSKTYNNPYAHLKKGYLEYGETVEEVFIELTKAREFSTEKGPAREFKKSIPDVRTAFHIMNYKVQYPITVTQVQLKQAFTSAQGVKDLIDRIIAGVYNSAEYDEFLLFKYLLIKGITKGHFLPVSVDTSDIKNFGIASRAKSNSLTFVSTKYNNASVHTFTPKEDQAIFIDSQFDAEYDVNVLASAFNMDKATYEGKRHLIDDWTTFDSERFEAIMEESDGFEPITAQELELMAHVKAVLVDEEYFQVYDNLTTMTSTNVQSALYTNYWYHIWKTLSWSPFSNAIVFVDNNATIDLPQTIDYKVSSITKTDNATLYTLNLDEDASLISTAYQFVQTKQATSDGVAITHYGSITVPDGVSSVALEVTNENAVYTGGSITVATTAVGNTITLTKQ